MLQVHERPSKAKLTSLTACVASPKVRCQGEKCRTNQCVQCETVSAPCRSQKHDEVEEEEELVGVVTTKKKKKYIGHSILYVVVAR